MTPVDRGVGATQTEPPVSSLPLVRVRLKYPDVETLVERFSPNVTRGGIFLASRDPKPVNTEIRFEVSLLGGTAVLTGEGKVTWVKPFDPSAPARPHGMGVTFTKIDPASKDMLRRLVERREAVAKQAGAGGPTPAARPAPPPETRDAVAADIESIDDGALRRAVERARALAARVDDVDGLLLREPEAVPSLAEALADLPRYLQRRPTV